MTQPRFASLTAAALFVAVAGPAAAADYRTENFVVHAPTAELAERFGEYAEKYRREKAVDWLGAEMPRWRRPCPLKVSVSPARTGGATTFTFNPQGGVAAQEMTIFGGLEQLVESVLPHEVTHTVLAHHFGQPVPRWADEGGSVLSENDAERYTHDVKCREILNGGRGIPLRHLFPMKDYPRDMLVLYAQGYSVSAFLIEHGGKRQFLQFLELGMRNDGWDEAVRQVYGDRFQGVDDLQEKWIAGMHAAGPRREQMVARGPTRAPAARPRPAAEAVSDTPPLRRPAGDPAASLTGGSKGADVRTSAVTSLPTLDPPVVARGVAADRGGQTFGSLPARGRDLSPAAASATPRPPLPKLGPPELPGRW